MNNGDLFDKLQAMHGFLKPKGHFSIQPIVSILAGLLILAVPRSLNDIVAIYLILIGILGLMRF